MRLSGGSIVNVASRAGTIGVLRDVPDRAERAARVTADVPLGRMGTVEEVAEAIAWRASPAYVSGTEIVLDGGLQAGALVRAPSGRLSPARSRSFAQSATGSPAVGTLTVKKSMCVSP